MTHLALTNVQAVWQERSPFLAALLLASLIHGLILLGITFNVPIPSTTNHTLAVTVHHIKPAINTQAHDTITPAPIQPAITPKPIAIQHTKPQQPATQNIPATPKILTRPTEQAPQASAVKPILSADALQQQISQLGERIRNTQPSTPQKVKFANTVSNHRYLAAQYVQDWENKVERTGNLNYPEAARHKREPQTLTMDVGINADGSIYSMRITRSSGNIELDEAAKRIVRMSAPFAELPAELLQEVNVLVITRVWKFSDETGMTSH